MLLKIVGVLRRCYTQIRCPDAVIVTYNLYLQLGVDGLCGLQNFNADEGVSTSRDLLSGVSRSLTASIPEMGPSAQSGKINNLSFCMRSVRTCTNVDS